jgi:arylsulfatase A-like enzyme
MPFFWVVPFALTPGFFASHLLFVLAVHVLLAVLLAGRRDDRPWALAALAIPPALGLWPAVHVDGSVAGLWLLLAALAGVSALGALPLPGRGAPLVASAAGGIIGGEWVRLRIESAQAEVSAAPLVAACVLAVAVVLLAARLPRAATVPRPRSCVAIAVIAVALALALGRVGATADPPSPPEATAAASPPSVVVVVLDTVRADHLRLHGYERDTMPRLERFAREQAIVADRAVANAPTSLATHASLFTGLYPPRHGAHHPSAADPNPRRYAYPLARGVPTMAKLLRAHGYWTLGVTANAGPLSPAFGLHRGFAVYDAELEPSFGWKQRTPWRAATTWSEPLAALDRLPPFAGPEFFEYGVPYRRAQRISDEAIALVDAAENRPFFLFVNYFDAHSPYNPPARWRDGFPGRRRRWSRLDGLAPDAVERVTRGDRNLTPEERAHLVSLYDSELRYLDAHLSRVLERLARHPRWNEMLVIITSDHGEAFGEHRALEHGRSLYGELTRVPLIVKPGVGTPGAPPAPSRLGRIVQSVDLFSTVLAHAGVEAPARIDGRVWGRGREEALTWVHFKQRGVGWRPERKTRDLRAIERDDWKLIEWSTGRLELYDLARDPGETRDVAREFPDRRDALRRRLGARPPRRAAAKRGGAAESAETLKRLRALGYVR